MAKDQDVKIYKCMNFGVCAKADSGELIKIPAIEALGGTPPCPCCRQSTLEEQHTGGGINKKLVGMICGGIAAVATIGSGIYALTGSGIATPESITLNHNAKTLNVGERDTLVATILPEGGETQLEWHVVEKGQNVIVDDNGIVTATAEGTTVVQVSVKDANEVKAVCTYTVMNASGTEIQSAKDSLSKQVANVDETVPKKASDSAKSFNLGWGHYEGPTSGGVPHGIGGEVKVTRAYSLDLKKSPAEYVELNRGDKIINTKFVNGELRQGEIHFADGTRRWVNL